MFAMSAADDAKSFLRRHPWGLTDTDDPKQLIEALVKENELLRASAQQLAEARQERNKSDAKVKRLLQELLDLVHSKAKMTHKRLRDVQRDLDAIK